LLGNGGRGGITVQVVHLNRVFLQIVEFPLIELVEVDQLRIRK
jgi:hypothetical protein